MSCRHIHVLCVNSVFKKDCTVSNYLNAPTFSYHLPKMQVHLIKLKEVMTSTNINFYSRPILQLFVIWLCVWTVNRSTKTLQKWSCGYKFMFKVISLKKKKRKRKTVFCVWTSLRLKSYLEKKKKRKKEKKKRRRFSNHVSRLLSRSHTFAIIVI